MTAGETPRLDLAERCGSIAALCVELGLPDQAEALRLAPGPRSDRYDEVRVVASVVRSAMACAGDVGRVARAVEIADAVMVALGVCDEVIAERHAANAAGMAPGLQWTARPYGGAR